MAEKNLNRIKVMLAEKGKTNKWLAEKLGRDQATISKWCTNACQPPLEALIQIAQCLEVDIKELISTLKPLVSRQDTTHKYGGYKLNDLSFYD